MVLPSKAHHLDDQIAGCDLRHGVQAMILFIQKSKDLKVG
jgi:hypothetical protein